MHGFRLETYSGMPATSRTVIVAYQIGEREGSAQSVLKSSPLLAPRYLGRYAGKSKPR